MYKACEKRDKHWSESFDASVFSAVFDFKKNLAAVLYPSLKKVAVLLLQKNCKGCSRHSILEMHWYWSNGNSQSWYPKCLRSVAYALTRDRLFSAFALKASSGDDCMDNSTKTSRTSCRYLSLTINVLLSTLTRLNAWIKGQHRLLHQNRMTSFRKTRPASVYALPVKSVTTFDDYARVAFFCAT